MSRHREDRQRRRGTDTSDASDSADGRRQWGERSGSGYSRRYARRYGGRGDSAQESASEQHGSDTGGRMPERAHGGRRSSPHHRRQGNARVGSQRGEDSVQGVSGRVGRQFGDLHGPRPSESEAEGYHAEEQFGGDTGRSSGDRRYGSRRGHGSQRREDRRTEPGT